MSNIPNKPMGTSPNKPSSTTSPRPTNGTIRPTSNIPNASLKPKVAPVSVKSDVINKQPVKKNDDKKDKKKRLLLLLLLLLIVFIAGTSVLLYFVLKPSSDIKLELSITTKINGEIIGPGTSMPTTKFIPGDEIPLELNFKIYDPSLLENSGAKVFARYKISAYVDDTYVSGLFDPQPVQGESLDVIKGDDNYFYYIYTFGSSDSDIVAFRALDFVAEYDNNILNGKSVNIRIDLEILEANYYAIQDMWNTSPNAWREIIRPQANS